MHEAVDRRHHAGRVREHVRPLLNRFVGRYDCRACLIPAADEFGQQVGMAVRVREVADLIDLQDVRRRIVVQTPTQRRIAVERRELAEHLAG